MKTTTIEQFVQKFDNATAQKSREEAEVAAHHKNTRDFLVSFSPALQNLNVLSADGLLLKIQKIETKKDPSGKGGYITHIPLEIPSAYNTDHAGIASAFVTCQDNFTDDGKPRGVKLGYEHISRSPGFSSGFTSCEIVIETADGFTAEDAADQLLASLLEKRVIDRNKINLETAQISQNPAPASG